MRRWRGRMRAELVELLRCPRTGSELRLVADQVEGDEVMAGTLVSTTDDTARYPIVHGIPRFVEGSNYTDSFGWQWNRFAKTQLDSHSGVPISRDRFYRYSGWDPADLRGRRVLEVGCGAGRFTEVVLDAGATVVSVDYSRAVDACAANHRGRAGFNVLQADMYRLPLPPASFDRVFCFGVLQHTPDVHEAFRSLARQVVPGGELVVDLYPWRLVNALWPKYWIRAVTRRMPPERLMPLVERMVRQLTPVQRRLGRVPVIGRHLRYMVPILDYSGVFPLSEEQLEEWAVLDTFDMLSAAHDHPQRPGTLLGWFREAGFEDVRVERMGFLVGRGRRGGRRGSAAGASAAA